jgi:hypothetical protein
LNGPVTNPPMIKDSTKTVDDFIRRPEEAGIKHFFLQEIDQLLEKYDLGKPDNKPDVLEQIRKIEMEREQMMRNHMQGQQQQQQQQNKLMMQKPGEEPRELTTEEISNILNQQKNEIIRLHAENEELKKMLREFKSSM